MEFDKKCPDLEKLVPIENTERRSYPSNSNSKRKLYQRGGCICLVGIALISAVVSIGLVMAYMHPGIQTKTHVLAFQKIDERCPQFSITFIIFFLECMTDSDCQNREYEKVGSGIRYLELHFNNSTTFGGSTFGKFCANGMQKHNISEETNHYLDKTFASFGKNKCVLMSYAHKYVKIKMIHRSKMYQMSKYSNKEIYKKNSMVNREYSVVI